LRQRKRQDGALQWQAAVIRASAMAPPSHAVYDCSNSTFPAASL
jgi:hypothetical protein